MESLKNRLMSSYSKFIFYIKFMTIGLMEKVEIGSLHS